MNKIFITVVFMLMSASAMACYQGQQKVCHYDTRGYLICSCL